MFRPITAALIAVATLATLPQAAAAHGETITITPTRGPSSTQITINFTSHDPSVCHNNNMVYFGWDYHLVRLQPQFRDTVHQGVGLFTDGDSCAATGQITPVGPFPSPGSLEPPGHVVAAAAAQGTKTDPNADLATAVFTLTNSAGVVDLPSGLVVPSPGASQGLSGLIPANPAVDSAASNSPNYVAVGLSVLAILALVAAIFVLVRTLRRQRRHSRRDSY